ncbi:MAG TPA: Txe/YoeB family addiction module toxin [Thermoanaerobaculia bacterium]|nr:Txe/YoeB family addiction module toxin [Thermoanaerobaculia bacterium]
MSPRNSTPLERRDRVAIFQPEFRDDLRLWIETDRKIALRLLNLVEAILRDPFSGIGKPEPLKHFLTGAWSRRLTEEHRIVYRVTGDAVDFLQARYHY